MKTQKLFILFLILLFPQVILTQNSVTDGLIHHYPFDGTYQNEIDPSLPATISSGAIIDKVQDRKSLQNKALSMNQSQTQYIIIPPQTLNNLNSFTVSMWVKANDISVQYQVFLSVARTGFNNELLIQQLNTFFHHNSGANSSNNMSFTDFFTDTTTWHHIAVVRDHTNSRVDFYLNGSLEQSMTGTYDQAMLAEGVVIGNDQDSILGGWSSAAQLKAAFNEFRIYDRLKTASEIQDIYNYVWCREDEIHNGTETECICQANWYRDSEGYCQECPERYSSCTDYSTPQSCQGLNRKPLGDDCICQDNFYEDPDSINCIAVVDPVTDSLIHYYPFDGRMDNVIDPSKPAAAGSGATINNSNDRFGQADRAYSIDDSQNQVLEIPPSTMDGLQSFTVSMWIKPNKITGLQGYFSVADSNRDNQLLIFKEEFAFLHFISDAKTSANAAFIPDLSSGTTWKHITVVRDQPYGKVYFYIDAVLEATLTGTSIETFSAEGIIIGNDQDSVLGGYDTNAQLDASFSDLRIYNTAKTPQDVQQIKDYIRCYPGEYPDTVSGCITCPERYGTCEDASTPLTCKGSNRKDKTQDCVCMDHYYEDPATDGCIVCPERYGNCSDDTTPLTCQGSNRKDKTQDCLCLDRHYEDSTSINCLECPERYGSCTDISTPGSCQGTGRKLLAQDCVCLDRYYEDSTSINCLECPERYGSCSDISTPITCQGTGRKDKTQDCACLDRYYEDSTSINCLECPERYGSCSDNTTPTSCRGTGRKNKTQDCVCLDRYYEDSSSENCFECPERYGSCTAASTPTSCQGNFRKDKTQDCVCLDRHYEDPSSINCIECHERYGSCTAVSTPTSCQGSNRKDKIQDCVCLGHFFEDPDTINCLECPDRYGTCTDLTTPNSCQGSNRKDTSEDCLCLDHFYQDPSSINCLECPEKYGNCSNDTTPLTCQGENRKSKEEDCSCEEGYYEDPISINCVKCPSNFETCTDENTPLTCQGNNRKGVSDNCTCIDGFFDNPINSDCLSCQYPCVCTPNPQKCGTCLSHPDDCIISCHESCAQCNSEGDCISCKLGQYLNNGRCEDCNSKCEICNPNNKDECLVCKDQNDIGRSLDVSNQCGCIDGYFENPSTLNCDKCQNEKCKQCDSTGICQSCYDENLLLPLCELNKKGNFYVFDEEGSYSPTQCDTKCETCENSSDNCLSCSKVLNRSPKLPCLCEPGYHDNNGTTQECQQCPKYCKICKNNDQCLECEAGRQLNTFSGQCECKVGYKENFESECTKCFIFEGKCFEKCPYHTQSNEKLYICESTQGISLSDNISLIWICAIFISFVIFLSMSSFRYKFKYQSQVQQNQKLSQ